MLFNLKLNSIQTLIVRACNICSSWIVLTKESTDSGNIFLLMAATLYTCLKLKGHYSFRIGNKLQPIFKCYLDLSFNFTFTNSKTIGSFVRYKAKLRKHSCLETVYSFQYPECNLRYTEGSTHRNLRIMISEHKGFWYRTEWSLTNPSFSVVRNHSREEDHVIREDDFQV